MCTGLVLRLSEPLRILDVRRHGVKDGPAAADHGLIHQTGPCPDVGQQPPIPVGEPDIVLQQHSGPGRKHAEQRVLSLAPEWALIPFRTIDADQADPSSI